MLTFSITVCPDKKGLASPGLFLDVLRNGYFILPPGISSCFIPELRRVAQKNIRQPRTRVLELRRELMVDKIAKFCIGVRNPDQLSDQ
jgi:hypothetical protein